MPLRIEQAETEGQIVFRQLLELLERLALHALLDALAILVEVVQLLGVFLRQLRVFAEQQLDADGHVVQPAGGIEARAEDETEVAGGHLARLAPGHFQQRLEPRSCSTGTDAHQPLVHEDTVVGVQRDHVGDAAEGDQIQQLGQIGLGQALTGEPAVLAQATAQGQHHIEDHPDPGDAFAGEGAGRLVRIDDGVGGGQLGAWQVVVGDDHLQPGRLGRGDAVQAGDAVVYGEQHLGFTLQGHGDDLGRQTVAVFEAIGHQIVDPGRAQAPQGQHAHGTGGGAIGIEVADDEDAPALFQGPRQQLHRRLDALELVIGHQPRQALVEFFRLGHAAGGIEPGEQRRQIAQVGQYRRQRTGLQAHQRSPSSHSSCNSC